jgi:VWFA-related protein
MRGGLQFASAASLLLAGLALAASAAAQAPAGPLPQHPAVTQTQTGVPSQQEKPGVRVRVNLVNAPVTVTDKKGELVLDLAEKDFRVFDNRIEQKIDHFDLGGDPLSIVLVMETSSRVEALLPAVRQSGIVFTQTVLGPGGNAAVVTCDDDVSVVQPFTSDADAIGGSVKRLREGTSGLRLYDALGRAVAMLKEQPTGRKRVILAVAEATDSGSENKLGEVLRQAQLANVTIYAVGLSTTAAELRAKPSQAGPPQIGPRGTFPVPIPNGQAQTPAAETQQSGNIDLLALAVWAVKNASNEVRNHALEVATTATGGLHVSTFRDRSIQQALDEIGGELHAQYSISYAPKGEDAVGYHEIEVRVSRPHLKVRTRPGYYIAPPAS